MSMKVSSEFMQNIMAANLHQVFEAGVQETTLSFCTEFKIRVQMQTDEEEVTNLCQTTDISSSNYCCH